MRYDYSKFAAFLVWMTVANLLAFLLICALGNFLHVSDNFPPWFKNSVGVCFLMAGGAMVAGALLMLSSRARRSAALSTGLAFGTMLLIVYLTTIG